MSFFKRRSEHDKVHIRKTHPGLYIDIIICVCFDLGLAWNFWRSNPTFNPYGIPKNLIGIVFLLFGIVLFMFLTISRNLPKLRITLAVSVAFLVFWGISNTEQWRNGKASLQLPICLLTIAAFQVRAAITAPVNPFTEKK